MSTVANISPMNLRNVCERIVAALSSGKTPLVTPEEIPCFAPSALEGDPTLTPDSLKAVLKDLGKADIATLQRAIAAIDANERAWLGFKIVTNSAAVLDSEDTDVVAIRGKGMGSADAQSGVFVMLNPTGARGDAQLIFSRDLSQRDRLQILDVTRGPVVHDEQYAGVRWKAVPLFGQSRVFAFGASSVSAELERVANMVDFKTVVVECDPVYLTPERFPLSERVLIKSYDAIPDLGITPDDYVCVLTRGHMHDPQALIYGIRSGAGYVGMMGSPEKNQRVFELAEMAKVDRAALEATHTPIGIKCGAKTPTEVAISITAELVNVRHNRRKAAVTKA